MPTKPRAGGRLNFDEISFEPPASDAAVCADDFDRIWLSQQAAAAGAREVYCVVAIPVSAIWHRDWVGHVPVFALIQVGKRIAGLADAGKQLLGKIDRNFPRMLM